MNAKYISFEGIGGTGKTYFFNKLKKKYNNSKTHIFLEEISDEIHSGLNKQIFSALFHTKNRFFDMGLPLTETMLLLANKFNQYESVLHNSLNTGKIVVQDRGFDTVAIYQSLVILRAYYLDMTPLDLVEHLHDFIDKYVIVPDTTFLFYGDISASIERAEARDKIPFSKKEKIFLEKAEKLYLEYAAEHSQRVKKINIAEKTDEEVLVILEQEL